MVSIMVACSDKKRYWELGMQDVGLELCLDFFLSHWKMWRPDRSLSLTAIVHEVAISNILCAPYLQQWESSNLSIKFIKGHILLHIMCFISLTQTYYAPGWRWPYESHKAGLMNVIVKAVAQYGLSVKGRSLGRKHALQKCMLIKMFLAAFPSYWNTSASA